MLHWMVYENKYEKSIRVINKPTALSKSNVDNTVIVSPVLTFHWSFYHALTSIHQNVMKLTRFKSKKKTNDVITNRTK